MNKVLLKIANLLTMNPQTGKESGLMNGKMGRALLYYELSRATGIKSYNNMGDILLEDVVCNVERMNDTSLESGLSGVGWGVNYAIRNSFIEADEEALDELEHYLFSEERGYVDTGRTFTFLSSAIYLLSKLGDKSTLANYENRLSILLETCNSCLSINRKKMLDLINSILYFLLELKRMDACRPEIDPLIHKTLSYLTNHENDKKENDSYGDVVILLNLLKQVENGTKFKEEAVTNLKKIAACGQWDLEAYKKMLWQQFLFADCIGKEEIDMDEILLHFADFAEDDAKELLLPLGLCLINNK